MGWDATQVNRLLREDWPTPTMLAQEIFAILSSNSVPLSTDAPVTINMSPDSTSPALTINTGTPGQAAVQVNNPDGSLAFSITDAGITFPPNSGLGSIELDGTPFAPVSPGAVNLGSITLNGSPAGPVNQNPSGFGADSPAATVEGTGGQGAIGTVLSGTGATYQVKRMGGSVISAQVPQIDPTATVPAGTSVVLTLIGTIWYFQPAVWL